MLIPIEAKYLEDKIHSAIEVYNILREHLLSKHEFDRQKEHFWTVILSRSNQIQFIDEVSIGNQHYTVASPREVFRFAILKGAHSIIVAHNHPSGNLNPSMQDKETTKNLVESGEILGIKVLDALIITEKSYYSMFENEDT